MRPQEAVRASAFTGVLLTALLALHSMAAYAGGPLVVTTAGEPVAWGASAVSYHTDLGGLGLLSQGAAVALVDGLFATWANVPTATITYQRAGSIAVDVDASNFGPYLGPYGGSNLPLGQNVIVFDADGAIFDTLYGVGTGVLGFAGPTFFSDGAGSTPIGSSVPPGSRIIEGIAFLNGKWIDGVDDPGTRNYELPLATFQAVFVHEFGHFSGLDHTQIHGLHYGVDSDNPYRTTPFETMFPFLIDETQATLEKDDVVAISVLYPEPGFSASTGRITGRVLTSRGGPISGVNVIARNVADDADAVSYVSGATMVTPGEFSLAGLTSGAEYRVEIQEVDAVHRDGSRVGPISPPIAVPGPPEFFNGPDESGNPDTDDPAAWTSLTAVGGVTLTGNDIVLNAQQLSVSNTAMDGSGHPHDIAVGDFDRDGILDFVAPQFGFSPGNLTRFYKGLGGGVFASPSTIDAFPGNRFIAAGQFNRGTDAFLDIAVLSMSLSELRIYLGNGAGGFGPPVALLDLPNFTLFPLSLSAADINEDTFVDLVTIVYDPNTIGSTLYAFLGSSTGAFTGITTSLPAGSAYPFERISIGQFAGSSAPDLLGVANLPSGIAALGLLIGAGDGTFTPTAVGVGSFSDGIGRTLAVGDFNEDGHLDVVLSDLNSIGSPGNFTRSFIDLLLGDGAGGFTFVNRYQVPEVYQSGIGIGDIDGDGNADIASTGAYYGSGSPGANLTVAFGDGAGGIRKIKSIWGLAEYPDVLVTADLDADGRDDLLVGDAAVGGSIGSNLAHYTVLSFAQICASPAACTDGVYCNGAEACLGFTCQRGAPPVCDDLNACTTDTCSPLLDACINTPGAPPAAAVTPLFWTPSTNYLGWSAVAGATEYHVYAASQSTLPELMNSGFDTCLKLVTSDISAGPVSNLWIPLPDRVIFYLVEAANDCGVGPIDGSTGGPRILNSTGDCGSSCAHDRCSVGGAMVPACDACVAEICHRDPHCCGTGWDSVCVSEMQSVCGNVQCSASQGTCTHPLCTLGDPLVPGCDMPPLSASCVANVCGRDPYCCSYGWDEYCVWYVSRFCHLNCD